MPETECIFPGRIRPGLIEAWTWTPTGTPSAAVFPGRPAPASLKPAGERQGSPLGRSLFPGRIRLGLVEACTKCAVLTHRSSDTRLGPWDGRGRSPGIDLLPA